MQRREYEQIRVTTPPPSPTTPPTLPSNDETPESVFTLGDNEEEVGFADTPTRVGMDINMVYYFPTKFRALD